jgi:hypothetical protein
MGIHNLAIVFPQVSTLEGIHYGKRTNVARSVHRTPESLAAACTSH